MVLCVNSKAETLNVVNGKYRTFLLFGEQLIHHFYFLQTFMNPPIRIYFVSLEQQRLLEDAQRRRYSCDILVNNHLYLCTPDF